MAWPRIYDSDSNVMQIFKRSCTGAMCGDCWNGTAACTGTHGVSSNDKFGITATLCFRCLIQMRSCKEKLHRLREATTISIENFHGDDLFQINLMLCRWNLSTKSDIATFHGKPPEFYLLSENISPKGREGDDHSKSTSWRVCHVRKVMVTTFPIKRFLKEFPNGGNDGLTSLS